jgi:hypothetical protein
MTPEFAEYEKRNYEAFKNARGNVSHVKYYTSDEAVKRTGMAGG